MLDCAEGRNRTGTGPKPRQILSLLRLPVPPPRQEQEPTKKTTSQAEHGNRGGPITIAATQLVVLPAGKFTAWPRCKYKYRKAETQHPDNASLIRALGVEI